MYRCFICDTPADAEHHADCMMNTQESVTDPSDGDERINIASGEDVELEPF